MRHAPLLLSLVLLASTLAAKTPPLSDYVGTYTDRPGHTLEIVAGDQLFAVQDSAKYKLQSSKPDEFTTITGNKIPFVRDASGKVTVTVKITVSADGKTRTVTGSQTDAAGKKIAMTAVYDKQ